MADPLTVACPDCAVPADTGCRFSDADWQRSDGLAVFHAERRRIADLRALEHGTCALCGQPMVRGSVEGAPVDAWHHQEADAAACPAFPSPQEDWNGYATLVNLGLSPGHPGVEHFVPTPETPDALLGVVTPPETDSAGVPLADQPPGTWDRADYEGGDPDTGPIPVCPECRNGKHPNCDGTAWDVDADAPTSCRCSHGSHRG